MPEPRHALFPAFVTLPDGTVHHPCRVATDTAGTTHAWAWIDNGPVEIGQWPADTLQRADERTTGQPRAFTTPDGALLDGRNAGCACSHPIKRWRPALVAAQS